MNQLKMQLHQTELNGSPLGSWNVRNDVKKRSQTLKDSSG